MALFNREKINGIFALLAIAVVIYFLLGSIIPAISFIILFSIPLYFMKPLPVFASTIDYISHYVFVAICTFIFIFLITPVLIIIPLSFNAEPYFTFTQGMLSLDPSAFSTRWYEDIVYNGMLDPNGTEKWWNVIATVLGTIAALGLSRSEMPYKAAITSLLISPMIVPLVITASGMFFFYSSINLAKTYTGVILAHVTLGIPFVIITVTATLSGFDTNLIKASQSLGAHGWITFRRVIMPLIMPGMISGALFAFITSLDEIVAVIFIADVEQRTIPRQMFSGIREQISPTILAVASVLVLISIILLTVLELLRRRSERLRGITPG